jgi:Zn-dependent peptidase ImmA (M78 family)
MRGIRSRIDLGPAVVHVRWVSEQLMRQETECEADDLTPEGSWDTDTDTVLLLEALKRKPRRARRIMLHELSHAVLDLYHQAE